MTITHTISRTFTFAGVTEYPRTIEPITGYEGRTLEAGDATPTNVWTSTRRRWRITWESARPEVVERWRGYYAARSTAILSDPYGQLYSCLIPVGGLQWVANFQPSSGTATGTTYTLSVELWEA